MKKITKKQGIIIGITVAIILVVGIVVGVILTGNNQDKKGENSAKTETITDKEADKDLNENSEHESKEEDKTSTTENDTQSETTDGTQSNTEEIVIEKTTMYVKSNVNVRNGAGASNSQIGSLTKGQEVVKIGEENGWSKIEFNGSVGYVKSSYLSTEKVSTSTTNNTGSSNSNNSVGNSNGSTNNNANIGNTTSSMPTHEHTWVTEKTYYNLIKTYINGCNGCGYPLFTITASGTENLENLYFHPACYSEKLGSDCTGGAFHSESYTSGYCVYCGGKVSYRQCAFTEMGKLCSKNEALGAYKKVLFNQNHFMYLDVCDCGENWIIVDSATNKGYIEGKEVCSTCGATK